MIIGLGLTVQSVRFQIVGTLIFVVALYLVGVIVTKRHPNAKV
ncbi:hypothetical protein [Brevibacterium sp. JSBI002]|nr:hypothetical protein [Brevibacterium sp. JSBI002]UZD61784.1 hypothetical protein LJ362_14080 [Brevibacterium sp. JSBI002]